VAEPVQELVQELELAAELVEPAAEVVEPVADFAHTYSPRDSDCYNQYLSSSECTDNRGRCRHRWWHRYSSMGNHERRDLELADMKSLFGSLDPYCSE